MRSSTPMTQLWQHRRPWTCDCYKCVCTHASAEARQGQQHQIPLSLSLSVPRSPSPSSSSSYLIIPNLDGCIIACSPNKLVNQFDTTNLVLVGTIKLMQQCKGLRMIGLVRSLSLSLSLSLGVAQLSCTIMYLSIPDSNLAIGTHGPHLICTGHIGQRNNECINLDHTFKRVRLVCRVCQSTRGSSNNQQVVVNHACMHFEHIPQSRTPAPYQHHRPTRFDRHGTD
jgi:hypothetical protein